MEDVCGATELDVAVPEECVGLVHPSTIEEAVDIIRAFYSADVSEPAVIRLIDELYVDFLDACEEACHGDPLYRMSYTYDCCTGNLIVKCTTAPAHDTVEHFFHTNHQAIIEEHSLTPSERSFDLVSTGDTGGFSGSHQGSRRTADAMIVPVLAEEIDEEGEVDEWLNDEDPVYSSKSLIQTQGRDAEPTPPPETFAALVNSPLRPPYGPIMRDGHVQVGAITVFLEIWRYDAGSKEAYKEWKIRIVPCDDDQWDFYLTMMDLYGKEERIPERFKPIDPVKFLLERFRRQIRLSLPRLALQRRQKIDQKRKMTTEDKKYSPEKEAKRVKRG